MLGLRFDVDPPRVPELLTPGESASEYVERLAREKALMVHGRSPDALVIAGDTVVVLGPELLEKPSDEEEAVSMLVRLAGRTHQVASGLAVVDPTGEVRSGVGISKVTFRSFDPSVALAYARTGEPLDKAGAYAIQGVGAALVERIEGDYFTVVGLSVALLVRLLGQLDWHYAFGTLVRGSHGLE